MRKQIMVLIAALAITIPAGPIAAAPKSPKLAKCDGKERRTANPYGSILPTVDPQTGTSTPAGQTPSQKRGQERGQEPKRDGVEVFPSKTPALPKPSSRGQKVKPVVPPISSAQPQRIYQSC